MSRSLKIFYALGALWLFCILAFIATLLWHWRIGDAFYEGLSAPSGEHVVPYQSHGSTLYVTAHQMWQYELSGYLLLALFLAIYLAMAAMYTYGALSKDSEVIRQFDDFIKKRWWK